MHMRHVAFIVLSLATLLGTAHTLFRIYPPANDVDMRFAKTYIPFLYGSFKGFQGVNAQQASNGEVDLSWHAPKKSWINDLGEVLNGTGTHGFVFGGSELPAGVKYGTYNWCNMPHVRKEEYPVAKKEFELVYVEV